MIKATYHGHVITAITDYDYTSGRDRHVWCVVNIRGTLVPMYVPTTQIWLEAK